MEVVVNDLGGILKDNDTEYIESVKSSLTHADPNCKLSIRKNNAGSLLFSITPAQDEFKQDIINNLLGLHRLLKIKIIFSKSLKISKIISFEVNL